MPTAVTIRLARPSEYDLVGRLTATAYAPVLHEGRADPYRKVLLDAAERAQAADLWVAANSDGQILGTVTVGRPGSTYAEIAEPHEIEVRMLAVDPSDSRRGVGRRLMAHVHALATEGGFAAVVLSVIASNEGAADFYAALGYQRVPSRDWRPRADLNIELRVYTYPVPPVVQPGTGNPLATLPGTSPGPR